MLWFDHPCSNLYIDAGSASVVMLWWYRVLCLLCGYRQRLWMLSLATIARPYCLPLERLPWVASSWSVSACFYCDNVCKTCRGCSTLSSRTQKRSIWVCNWCIVWCLPCWYYSLYSCIYRYNRQMFIYVWLAVFYTTMMWNCEEWVSCVI